MDASDLRWLLSARGETVEKSTFSELWRRQLSGWKVACWPLGGRGWAVAPSPKHSQLTVHFVCAPQDTPSSHLHSTACTFNVLGPRQRLNLSHVRNLSLKASNLTCFAVWEALFSVWSYSLRNFTCVSHDSDIKCRMPAPRTGYKTVSIELWCFPSTLWFSFSLKYWHLIHMKKKYF